MIDRVIFAAFCIVTGCAGFLEPSLACADEVVFEDHDLDDWQFLVPPDDPEIQIRPSPPGESFLTVRHHHTAQFHSLKRSIQGSAQAQYAPATSGAVETFAFAGRFRAHYEGVGPVEAYRTRILGVQAVVLQGGQSFVAWRDLFTWADSDATLNQWVSVPSVRLMESDFRLDGPADVHPDFSADGEPMTLALRVSSFYQTSYEEIHPDNTFAVDIDDVRVTAEAPIAGDLPRLSFQSVSPLLQMTCGALEVFRGRSQTFNNIVVQLSEFASSTRRFRMLKNGVVYSPVGTQTEISANQNSATIQIELGIGINADLYQLESVEGGTIGEPSRLAVLVSTDDDACAFGVQALWKADLRAQGCEPMGDETGSARSLADAPSGIPEVQGVTELQALRDQVMATTPAGRYYAELYKTLSPAIVRTLVAHPPLLVDLFLSQDAWVDALATLTEGGANTTQVSADMAADLHRLLDGFESQGSPALARTIAHERARLGLSAISGLTMNQFWQRVNDRWDPEPCVADEFGLCLGGGAGGRYRVETDWATPAGGIGGSGRGRAVGLSGDSGYFWFFDSANVEVLTKIVDGCGFNQRIWSYSAGLTNLAVELFVFDSATGRGKSYDNPQAASFAPILDSDFLECAASSPIVDPVAAEKDSPMPMAQPAPSAAGSCVAGPQTLCLADGRFRVEADWRTAAGTSGAAQAVPLTGDTGTFWFFHSANIELVVKTIDACGLAGFENYWVFAGGTTDVEVTLRVTDTLREVQKTYHRPQGAPFAPILDTDAFATCP